MRKKSSNCIASCNLFKFTLDNKFNGTDLLFNHLLILHLPRVTTINLPLYKHRIVKTSRVHRKNKQMQKGFMIIVDTLINEVEKIGLKEQMNFQLALYFIRLQDIAAYDLFQDVNNKIEMREAVNSFIDKFNMYYDKNFDLNLEKNDLNRRLYFFFNCMRTYSSRSLIIFYTIFDISQELYLPLKLLRFNKRNYKYNEIVG